MEILCNRCHQAVLADSCYCPACGLPQLLFASEGSAEHSLAEGSSEVVRDAGTIEWKAALRIAFLLGIPAGILSSDASQAGRLGLLWMATAAGWAVVLYVRSQRPAWITIGAGARIGLVTGLIAGWLAFGISGASLFVDRFAFHQAGQIDAAWKSQVELNQQVAEQFTAGLASADPAQMQAARAQMTGWMLTPEGHAGMQASEWVVNAFFLALFAICGGALGARLMVGRRRPEI